MVLRTVALTSLWNLQSCLVFVIFWKNHPVFRLANVDTPFVPHITGECTDGGGSVWERLYLLQSEVPFKEYHIKEARVLHMTLNYITSVCMGRKKSSRSSPRTTSCSLKEIRRELQSILIMIQVPSGQGTPGQPLSHVVGEACIDPTPFNHIQEVCQQTLIINIQVVQRRKKKNIY